jgi:glycerophosphoryl diester phosphodiesterase
MHKSGKQFIKSLDSFTPVGHRGAQGEVPGNTIESFAHLLEIFPGAILELDVWGTRDGKIVVYHDELLDHETDGRGTVSSHTFDELRAVDRGYRISRDGGVTFPFRGKGFTIPLFEDVLKEFPHSKISIDIKQHETGFAGEVMKMLERHHAVERVIAGSFDDRINRFISEWSPGTATSFRKGEVVKFTLLHTLRLGRFYQKKNDALMIPEFASSGGEVTEDEYGKRGVRIVSERFIRDAHRLDIPVFIWTINREENMKRLIDWGVDGIVTDYPSRLKKVMIEKGIVFN